MAEQDGVFPLVETTPDWLARRDGTLKAEIGPETLLVMLSGQPLYKLVVRPAEGKHTCVVTQTNNGKLLDTNTATFLTADAAIAGGLEQLRTALGW